MPAASRLDLKRFAATPLARDPFDHVIVPGFVPDAICEEIDAGFPRIDKGGSYPAQSLDCGPAFTAFLDELEGAAMREAVEAKFGLDLTDRPTMVTLRGRSRAKDGRIHTDSASKLITALIYMNPGWEADGGRLRLLRDPADIESYAAEVPPARGTLLAFRCTPAAYHGHKPFVGVRRSIQLNWVADAAVLKRELARHGLSAWTKRILGFAGPWPNEPYRTTETQRHEGTVTIEASSWAKRAERKLRPSSRKAPPGAYPGSSQRGGREDPGSR